MGENFENATKAIKKTSSYYDDTGKAMHYHYFAPKVICYAKSILTILSEVLLLKGLENNIPDVKMYFKSFNYFTEIKHKFLCYMNLVSFFSLF